MSAIVEYIVARYVGNAMSIAYGSRDRKSLCESLAFYPRAHARGWITHAISTLSRPALAVRPGFLSFHTDSQEADVTRAIGAFVKAERSTAAWRSRLAMSGA